ncbi:hypothetical protein [Microbispora sp. CA-102843]|uniref:hypothetical protein n=1 Tax=Microbispora sp. CA-102843 TaxID=3239952 RepID=UPI003D8C210F
MDNRGDRAVPCPNCRPEVARHLRRAPGPLSQARAGLRYVPRPSRRTRPAA